MKNILTNIGYKKTLYIMILIIQFLLLSSCNSKRDDSLQKEKEISRLKSENDSLKILLGNKEKTNYTKLDFIGKWYLIKEQRDTVKSYDPYHDYWLTGIEFTEDKAWADWSSFEAMGYQYEIDIKKIKVFWISQTNPTNKKFVYIFDVISYDTLQEITELSKLTYVRYR